MGEMGTDQFAALITPEGGQPVTVAYTYADGGPDYPASMFIHRANRFTRAADDLVRDARRFGADAHDGNAGIAAIVNDVARKFTYAHPAVRFNDGKDEVPHLSCGLTEGSCVDINTYLIATLRAAGYEAGYVTGYFFPAEKRDWCDDMHCWVVTRCDGMLSEWDIAHHLKLGTTDIRSGLNPKPGRRVAVCHTMGLNFPLLNLRELKLLAEPVWIDGAGNADRTEPTIRVRTQGERPSTESLARAS
jgi:hypothetical protein